MNRKIILASGSPQRRKLLTQMGINFDVVPSNYDERLDDTRDVNEVASELGVGKARAVAEKYPAAIVVGSDTIICSRGKQLGKQTSQAAARELQKALSGRSIKVITSVAIVCKALGVEEVEVDIAEIVFKPYDNKIIEAYLRSGDWQGKAGGVAIQSPNSPPVEYIRGSYDTVLGLATKPLAAMLRAQGVDAVPAEPKAPWLMR